MFKRTSVIFMLISVIAIAGFGMYAGAEHSGEQTMSHCLFHMTSGMNSMKLGEHIENWRNSVFGIVSFELPLLFSFFIFVFFSIFFFFLNFWKVKLIQTVQDLRKEPPKLSNYFNLLFSSGLLHPKIF